MIINTLTPNKIKILIDETDLTNAGISLKEWTSNSQKTYIFLNKLINTNSNNIKNFINLPQINFINFKEFNIFTYNFKIFSIEILF